MKKETIHKLLNNRITWIIASLLISFFIWAYLAGSDTTTFNQTFYNVPVVFQGADALRTTKGLIITDPAVETVTVQVHGSRATIGSLQASELQAVVDVSGISQARETELTYTIVFPDRINRSDISVVSRNPETINFTVAAESTKTVEVKGVFTGSVAEGYMADAVVVEPSTITLYGPESELRDINEACVYLDREDVNATVGPLKTDYVLLDQDGNEIDPGNIVSDTKNVTVTLPILMQKELKLAVNLIDGGGATKDDCVVEIEPETIQVMGDTSALQQLNQIVIGSVNLAEFASTYENTFTIPLDNALRNQSGVTEAVVRVTVNGLDTKRVTTKNISVIGADSGIRYVLETQSLTVTVRGKADLLKEVDADNVRAVVDLTDYANTSGTISVPVKIYIDGFEKVGAVGTYTASVKIS